MIFICVLFGFSLAKAFFFDRVFLQSLIVQRRTRFVLNGAAFLFVKDVLDLWYIGYFLFLAVGKL